MKRDDRKEKFRMQEAEVRFLQEVVAGVEPLNGFGQEGPDGVREGGMTA